MSIEQAPGLQNHGGENAFSWEEKGKFATFESIERRTSSIKNAFSFRKEYLEAAKRALSRQKKTFCYFFRNKRELSTNNFLEGIERSSKKGIVLLNHKQKSTFAVKKCFSFQKWSIWKCCNNAYVWRHELIR